METFAGLVGTNRLFWAAGLANPASRLVVAPNRDTVYAIAVLDLRTGPQVLTVPALAHRYGVFQFLDAWMNTFAYVGTRATKGRAGSWIVVPPGFSGAVPAGMHLLRATTNQVIILGRLRAVDDADAAATVGLRRDTTLVSRPDLAPGAACARATASCPARPAPSPLPKPQGTPQSVGANGAASFDELGDDLAVNPPVSAPQQAVIRAAGRLGIGAGRHPGRGPVRSVLAEAVRAGLRELQNRALPGSQTVNGWSVNLRIGRADPQLGLREEAAVARYGWGPTVAEEAVYPRAVTASDRRPLDGAKRYVIHVAKGNAPPVDAFWSYTAYGPDMFFVPNATGRYSISGDTPGLVRNPDGSLDVYLQHDPPAGHEANWLPVPSGPFNLVMRLYLPRRSVLDGTYPYPAVTVAGP
jgi:hypothetical protein